MEAADERFLVVEHEVDPDRLAGCDAYEGACRAACGSGRRKAELEPAAPRVLVLSMGRVADLNELRRLCPANMVCGSKTDEGTPTCRRSTFRSRGCPPTKPARR